MAKENDHSTVKKIAIVGNSVALRVRPPLPRPHNTNYAYLLSDSAFMERKRESGFQVQNISTGGGTVRSVFQRFDEVIRLNPDIYILNFGVVDACTREIPRWFFNLNNGFSQRWYSRLSRAIYGGIIKRIRRPLVFLRFQTSWVGRREFKRLYSLLVESLLKETNAAIIGLSINPADERVERQLPGSRKNQLQYNSVIRECLQRDRCRYLDLTDLDSKQHYPDGVHYSREGHTIVAIRLIELIGEMIHEQ